MTRSSVVAVLLVSFLAGGLLGVGLYAGLEEAVGEDIKLETAPNPPKAANSEAVTEEPVELKDLPSIGDLGVQLSGDGAPQPAADQAVGGDMLGGLMRTLMKSMAENPTVTEITRKQFESDTETTYLPLFRKLALSEGDRKKLSALLVQNEVAASQNLLRLFSAGMTVEGMQSMTKEIESEQQRTRDQIATLLGPRGFAEYEKFNEGLGYRMFAGKLRQKLAAEGHPLTDEQEERLIVIMQQEDAKMLPFDAIANNEDLDDVDLSVEALAPKVEERDKRVAKRAAEILSDAQLRSFVAIQDEARQMMSLGSEIGNAVGQNMVQELLQGMSE